MALRAEPRSRRRRRPKLADIHKPGSKGARERYKYEDLFGERHIEANTQAAFAIPHDSPSDHLRPLAATRARAAFCGFPNRQRRR